MSTERELALAQERSRRYRLANPEKVRLANLSYRKKNRELSRASKKKYQQQHPEQARKSWLKQKYGMTSEQFQLMLEEQGGVCAICLGGPTGAGKKFHVDHDHATGKIRGLLCHRCNVGIALLKEDVETMKRAIRYLETI